jgi:CheY-like chemotaxis protein
MVGEAGDFTSLIGIPLQSPVLQQAGAFLLGQDSELKAIPVVAVTAFAMRGDEERIREAGCEAYLSKPVPVPQFIETVRRFFGVGLSNPAR